MQTPVSMRKESSLCLYVSLINYLQNTVYGCGHLFCNRLTALIIYSFYTSGEPLVILATVRQGVLVSFLGKERPSLSPIPVAYVYVPVYVYMLT